MTKVILVTGGTSGIGRAAATALAAQGAHVIIGGRDQGRAERAREEIAAEAGGGQVDVAVADLSVQDGVRRLAADVLERVERLDVLINNAGVDLGQRRMTADGLEETFAINVVAPFLLTWLLLDRLRASAPARILNVVSSAHQGGSIDFDDLQSQRKFGQRTYNNSKLALVMLTQEWSRHVDPALVTVNGVDPGFVRGTNIGRTLSVPYQAIGTLMMPFMATPKKAAGSLVWAATDPELATVTGAYIKNHKIAASSKRANDREVASRLWDVVSELSGAAKAGR